MSKHTPGPWFYQCRDEWSHEVVTHHGELPDGSASFWTVASINKRREPDHVANARLIASAPDLLDALKLCQKQLQGLSFKDSQIVEALERTQAAIFKAEGEA